MDETKRHKTDIQINKVGTNTADIESFVLEKSIFRNVFDKDIQRVYIYKKSERLAKAVQLITPAFRNNPALQSRLERISVGLIDAAIAPSNLSRTALSNELLALSSILSVAKTAGILSVMNADFISQESHNLLQEVAVYEEPRVALEDTPSIAMLARASVMHIQKKTNRETREPKMTIGQTRIPQNDEKPNKGHIKDIVSPNSRRESILSVIRAKGSVYIKEVSTVIRNVSEKTIQRELQALVVEGVISKSGERRWTRYSLVR